MICTYVLVDPRVKVGPPKPYYVGLGIPSRPYHHFDRNDFTYLSNVLKHKITKSLLGKKFRPDDCIRIDRYFEESKKAYDNGMLREAVLIVQYGTVKKIRNTDYDIDIKKGLLTNRWILTAQRKALKRHYGRNQRGNSGTPGNS